MSTTQASTTDDEPTTTLVVVKDPQTPKEKSIVDHAIDDPHASNPTIADRVENDIGERPDESWVSRVRSTFLAEADGTDDPPPGNDTDVDFDSVIERLDRVEDAVDGIADDFAHGGGDVDEAIDAVEALTESVDALRDDVRAMNSRLERIEDMVARDVTEDVERVILHRRLAELEDAE